MQRLEPAVRAQPPAHPLVADHAHGRQPLAPHPLDEAERHPAHAPPRDGVRAEAREMTVEHPRVVPLDPGPLEQAVARERVVAPVPAQLAVDVRVELLAHSLGPMVAGQHLHLVPAAAQVQHRRAPRELIPAAHVVWGVDVAYAEDPHRDRRLSLKLRAVDRRDARDQPEVSVVVPSHERPLRLRWLLNALEEQTLPAERWEAVVAHDSSDAVAGMIDDHPLARAGVLTQRRLEPGTGTPARHRNLGWRATRAPLVAFTDDDCRPEPDWLETLLDAGHRNPATIVQGATRPDPFESDL